MRRSDGFTLVEVMLGLVITGVVALLVYGALRTAADTEARLADGRVAARAELAWRAIIADAVRGVRSSLDYDEPTLVVQDGMGPAGHPADHLMLVTGAGSPPLAPGADWRVSLETGARGLVAEATPLGRPAASRVLRAPEGFTGIDVEVLAGGRWLDAWPGGRELPRAIRVTFWTAEGPRGMPLVLALPLAEGP
jgi:prepilin-type N-terminal cleavage/methylation domain-containing protein